MKKQLVTISKVVKSINNSDINYVACVCTPWHVHSLKASIKYIEERDKVKLKGIVLITEHSESGYLINEMYMDDLDSNVYYFEFDTDIIKRLLLQMKVFLYYNIMKKNDDKRQFYVFNPYKIPYTLLGIISGKAHKNNITLVLIDEGIGIYITSKKSWLKIQLDNEPRIICKLMKCVNEYIIYPMYDYKLNKKKRIINCYLLDYDKEKGYVQNDKMVEHYKEIILKDIKLGEVVEEPKGNYVLYNSQPLEDKLRENELEILVNLKKICEKYNTKFIVKQHPRDNSSIYIENGFDILDAKAISQESLLMKCENKPVFILSYDSTTLVSSRLINDVDSVSVGKMFYKGVTNISEYIASFEKFRNAFGNIVCFVDNYEDFEKLFQE